mmetsp:Transcript_11957/g.17175  ORF Transcript_11957/g.17175 Transcript_11957/m.17175 type:complete len:526 (-) Transcript_11957:116-1693(-)|eukprot:CAMPEP_0201697620 /NCGR_PEP_ID=MMETSP0578-20130828/11421_1 /ASSEMBLY_ACC=CAM_ASM_000663 /TAXON_ID=267565 /ORGANISM="Skeletonema grethea, Strain CCMP 1804" /LENGTH=525 /DNA_ID=CAMNT_0048183825 /DNA_START=44 /DNA_END=1621 /DNA_ORIENTATION=+
MKFSMLTIAGALAAANAASTTRGDAAKTLKKMALMQKFTDTVNKKAFGGFTRRLQDEDEQNYEYGEQEEVTAETIIQPYMCVTATVYNGNNNNNNNANANGSSAKPTISYLSFVGATDANNNGYEYLYGNNDEYMTTLSAYLQAIGTSWAEERAQLCDDCEMMEKFCEMSDDERSYFANMSEDDFAAYIEELEQQYKEEQQEQQEKAEEEMEQDENNAYAAYNYGNGQRGRRHLFESIQTICNTCEQKCVDDDEIQQSQEYYEEMEKLFEEAMCVQSGDGSGYIGHTCGSNGKSIELALFTDENCMYMAGEQNAYSLYQQAVAMTYGDGDADGDGEQDYDWNPDDLAYGYMNMVTEMFSDEYSCQMGAVRSYDGADPSEACENLYENAYSKSDCMANMYNYQGEEAEEDANANNNNYNQYEYNGNAANGNNYLPEGYDMVYSEDIADVCGTILELEANLANSAWMNPFQGDTFQKLFQNNGLSGGAIAGILIAVIAAIAAVAMIFKKKETKTDLEEPVFQGGDLS